MPIHASLARAATARLLLRRSVTHAIISAKYRLPHARLAHSSSPEPSDWPTYWRL